MNQEFGAEKREKEVVRFVQILEEENLDKITYLEEFSLTRATGGLSLSVKSPIFAEMMMKYKSKGELVKSNKWSGDSFLPLKDDFMTPIKGAVFTEVGGGLFHNDQTVNLSFLRATHLSDGVKLHLGGVYSSSLTQDFVLAALDKMQNLFAKQCKPFSVGGKLYVEVR